MKIKVIELVGNFEKQVNTIIYELEKKKNAKIVDINYLEHEGKLKAVLHYVCY
ncbi:MULTISPECIES: hypothetical protein [Macrococcoides]|uniref:hypothetical protein n=1 Tax=Macrococcoides TaxID=3076173 RepID=UPI00165DA5A1|nr:MULTISPECIES: hypothetical protein [Macrococcus]MCO4095725.1 hypothetical protein [Macrococcus canis]QNR08252.1 hypothetical protein GL258_08260 [Macrococcus canis]UTG99339.1 hypothetical protein KFV04_07450 [Macrococcus canis]UTH08434.1 hypothetical protein KFV08_07825 [Macrococcus canis]